MQAPEIPSDEEQRLEALHSLGLLDTGAEEQYDRITRLAQLILKTPIALISLVDAGRQWFKSRQGLGAAQTPRDISFCGHAILDDRLFVVPDATRDPRFADNPLVVAEPSIRLYAGYPLKAAGGSRVGTLCIIDDKPRVLAPEEEEALKLLGQLVELQFRGLQQVHRLREASAVAARLSAIVEGSDDAILTTDLAAIITSWNAGATRLFGYSETEAVGRSIEILFPTDRLGEEARDLERIRSGQRVDHFEMVRRRKDGSLIDVSVTISPLKDGDGTIIGASKIARDISAQKKSREMLRALVEAAPNALVLADRAGSISLANRQAEELFGYKREQLLGRNVETLLPPYLRMSHVAKRDAFFVDPSRRPMGAGRDLYGFHKDGREIPIEIGLNPVRIGDGDFVLASIIDITERKRIEQHRKLEFEVSNAIARSSDFSRTAQEILGAIGRIIGAATGAIWTLNHAEGVLQCSDFWAGGTRDADFEQVTRSKVFGYGKGLAGRVWEAGASCWIPDVVKDHNFTRATAAARADLHSALAFPVVVGGRLSSVVEFLFPRVAAAPPGLLDAFATIGLQIGQFLERRQAAEDLVAARDAALEAARAKSDFLANMSHEIRTPMNAVVGMTGLLLDTRLAAEQRDYVETIRNAGEGLLSVINDILDFSKVEAGKMVLEETDFDVQGAVFGVVELLGVRALARGIELGAVVDADVPTWVRGDPGRLKQILINLVSNGVKFTENGGVSIRVMLANRSEEGITLEFVVKDTGIGIAAEVQGQLFRPFIQADASTTRRFGGTGLGLSIAKHIAELMGGSMTLSSIEGHGSEFLFTAKFGSAIDAHAEELPPVQLDGMRVHYVDDNAVNRQLLQHMLGNWKMEPLGADSGERSLEILRAAARAGRPLPLAILDFQMPRMDGLQLARAIKADPEIAQTQLILLSSAGTELCAEELTSAGICKTLCKPVRQSALLDAIATVMSLQFGPRTMRAEPRPALVIRENVPRKNFRVLVVEDNVVNQRVAVLQLRKLGYPADAVANGLEALSATERGRYHLVLMDCNMPEMDGYRATSEIRRREGASHHTPIVALTANALSGDRQKCLEAGMDDYLSKPIRAEELRAVLHKWDPPLSPETIGTLHELLGADRSGLDEIFREFLCDLGACRRNIGDAVAAKDKEALRRAAHKLKGSSGVVGANRLADICGQLEELARDDAGGDATALLAVLEEEIRITEEAVHGQLQSDPR